MNTRRIELNELQADCRKALGAMSHGRSILTRSVSRDVRETLEDIGLASEHTGGQLTPTPRAAGYCADPKSFELG
jgi:hypothetical protein